MDVTAYALSLTLLRIVMDVGALNDLKKKVSEEFYKQMDIIVNKVSCYRSDENNFNMLFSFLETHCAVSA